MNEHPEQLENSHLTVGIDGGASRTRLVLLQTPRQGLPTAETSRVLARTEAGPTNPLTVGREAAITELREALLALWHQAGLPPDLRCDAGCFAISGSARPAQREPLNAAVRQWNLIRVVRFVHDAEPLLADVPGGAGIALIAGTGSFAWGRNESGTSARCGGCGGLLGDEGSGFWIGLQGLRAVARGLDGRGPVPAFAADLLESRNVTGLADLIETAPSWSKGVIAALAPPILEAAWSGDETAQAITHAAVSELVELVTATAARLDALPAPLPVALSGGLLVHHRRLVTQLTAQLTQTSFPFACHLVADPAHAAARLALRADESGSS